MWHGQQPWAAQWFVSGRISPLCFLVSIHRGNRIIVVLVVVVCCVVFCYLSPFLSLNSDLLGNATISRGTISSKICAESAVNPT